MISPETFVLSGMTLSWSKESAVEDIYTRALRLRYTPLRANYSSTCFNQTGNSAVSIFSTALPQRSSAQPQKSKSIFDISA